MAATIFYACPSCCANFVSYGMPATLTCSTFLCRFPDDNEYVLMLRSIVDVNLCKFLSHDVPLFNGIVSDLFPGIALPNPDYTDLQAALRKQCIIYNLQPTDYSMMKVSQVCSSVWASLQQRACAASCKRWYLG